MAKEQVMMGAVFTRVGRDDSNGVSIERQIAECEQYAKEQGIKIVEVFRQTGPADFDRALEGLSSGRYETIVVTHPTRITRNFDTFLSILGRVKESGGTVHIASHRRVLP